MAELADVQDLGSCAARRAGSTPVTRTNKYKAQSCNGSGAFYYAYLILPRYIIK